MDNILKKVRGLASSRKVFWRRQNSNGDAEHSWDSDEPDGARGREGFLEETSKLELRSWSIAGQPSCKRNAGFWDAVSIPIPEVPGAKYALGSTWYFPLSQEEV